MTNFQRENNEYWILHFIGSPDKAFKGNVVNKELLEIKATVPFNYL